MARGLTGGKKSYLLILSPADSETEPLVLVRESVPNWANSHSLGFVAFFCTSPLSWDFEIFVLLLNQSVGSNIFFSQLLGKLLITKCYFRNIHN